MRLIPDDFFFSQMYDHFFNNEPKEKNLANLMNRVLLIGYVLRKGEDHHRVFKKMMTDWMKDILKICMVNILLKQLKFLDFLNALRHNHIVSYYTNFASYNDLVGILKYHASFIRTYRSTFSEYHCYLRNVKDLDISVITWIRLYFYSQGVSSVIRDDVKDAAASINRIIANLWAARSFAAAPFAAVAECFDLLGEFEWSNFKLLRAYVRDIKRRVSNGELRPTSILSTIDIAESVIFHVCDPRELHNIYKTANGVFVEYFVKNVIPNDDLSDSDSTDLELESVFDELTHVESDSRSSSPGLRVTLRTLDLGELPATPPLLTNNSSSSDLEELLESSDYLGTFEQGIERLLPDPPTASDIFLADETWSHAQREIEASVQRTELPEQRIELPEQRAESPTASSSCSFTEDNMRRVWELSQRDFRNDPRRLQRRLRLNRVRRRAAYRRLMFNRL